MDRYKTLPGYLSSFPWPVFLGAKSVVIAKHEENQLAYLKQPKDQIKNPIFNECGVIHRLEFV